MTKKSSTQLIYFWVNKHILVVFDLCKTFHNYYLINVYILGLFVPEEGKPPIWELLTDYYLHHPPACRYSRKRRLLTQWWNKNVLKCLPYAFDEITKSCLEMVQVQNSMEEMIDVYYDYHRYSITYFVTSYIYSHIYYQFILN